jgi:hypothetical protein
LKYCRENGIDPSEGGVNSKMLNQFMTTLPEEEKKKINQCSQPVGSSEILDLQRLQETNPALYKKIMNYCSDNGIDMSTGIVNAKLLKKI